MPVLGLARGLGVVPELIKSGVRAVVVQMDVWGFAGMLAASLEKGWEYAMEVKGGKETDVVANGPGKSE